MYSVTIFNSNIPTIIHSDIDRIDDAAIIFEKNAIGSFTFTIYPNSEGYELLTEFATTVEVVNLEDGSMVFEGRVIACSPSMDSNGLVCKEITCEQAMGYLCDSLQPYTEDKTWTGDENRTGIQEYIDFILENHNEHMPADKRIYRGTVDIETHVTNNNVTKGTHYERTFNLIKSKLIDVFGGEIQVKRGNDGLLRFDYMKKIGIDCEVPIRVAYNMESGSRELNPDRLITRLYPLGCKLTTTEVDENGNEQEIETEERLTIESIVGALYIDDSNLMNVYGVIEGTNTWDDITSPSILRTTAMAWLAENNKLPVSTSLTGYDLSLIGLENEKFEIYNWYPCKNPLIGLDETLEIVKQKIDLNSPHKSTIELGDSVARQSQKIATLNNLAGDVEVIKSQSKTTETNLKNSVVYTKTALEVAEDKIVTTVGKQIVQTSERIDGEIKTLSSAVSQIEQDAESIKLSVQAVNKTANEAKEAADAAVANTYEEYTITGGRLVRPSENAEWTTDVLDPDTGEFVWRRTVTVYGDGSIISGQAVLLTGESVAAVEITTSNGSVIRNSQGSTTLEAAVLYGGERITTLAMLESYFGAGACLVWLEKEANKSDFVQLPLTDSRLSNSNFSLTVNSAGINADSTYICQLVTTS